MRAALLRVLVAWLVIGLTATVPLPTQAKGADFGVWSPTPNLPEGHVAHTATLLNDGRVLIAGGTHVDGIATAGCELFDPKANRWIHASSMMSARAGHAATLLADGDVLVTGGGTGIGFDVYALASSEIYHPATNSWTSVAAMHAPRLMHSSMRLHDGRVLVVGGTNLAPGSPLPAVQQVQAELYDPARDRWSLVGAGLPPLSGEAATLMPGGGVLVTGGSTYTGFTTVSAELFDQSTSRWLPTTWPMATPRYRHTATLLPDGKVLLVGGYTTTQQQTSGGVTYPVNEMLTTSEIFDLRGNTAVRVGYSKIPRFEHTATLLRSGTVLVVGSAYASNADSQILDPKNTEQWTSTGLTMDRYLHTATMLPDGRVLIAGGYGVGSPTMAWIFSPGSVRNATSAGPLIQVTVVLLLVVLISLALAARSGRLRRRRPGPIPESDSKWIDP